MKKKLFSNSDLFKVNSWRTMQYPEWGFLLFGSIPYIALDEEGRFYDAQTVRNYYNHKFNKSMPIAHLSPFEIELDKIIIIFEGRLYKISNKEFCNKVLDIIQTDTFSETTSTLREKIKQSKSNQLDGSGALGKSLVTDKFLYRGKVFVFFLIRVLSIKIWFKKLFKKDCDHRDNKGESKLLELRTGESYCPICKLTIE